jgi:threonine/homoserine/homoserine lactone efflux protein
MNLSVMPVSSLITFAVALGLAAGAPGPSVGALVTRVFARGIRDVLPFLIAMWLGEAAWLTAAVTGLAAIAARFTVLFWVFKLVGVVYLLILAGRMWRTAGEGAAEVAREPRSAWQTFVAGLTITMGNPKIAVFYLALLPSLIDLRRITIGAWSELTVLTVVVLMVVDLGWSMAAARARRWMMKRRSRVVANRVSATVMAGAAVAIAVH